MKLAITTCSERRNPNCAVTGKTCFKTYREAHTTLLKRQRYKDVLDKEVFNKRIYYCEHCHCYHFTTIENKAKLYAKTSGETYVRKRFDRNKLKDIRIDSFKDGNVVKGNKALIIATYCSELL